MMEELKQQQKDDVKQKDFCVAEFNENEKQTVLGQDTMSDLTAEIETLTATLDTLKKELAAADAEIKDTKLQMTRASEDREAENAEFQQTVADQRAAQQILTLALNRMKEVYGKKGLRGDYVLAQVPETETIPSQGSRVRITYCSKLVVARSWLHRSLR